VSKLRFWFALGLVSLATTVLLPAQQAPPAAGAARGQRGAGAAPQQPGQGRSAEGGFTSAPEHPAVMLFKETWATEATQPMVQASISNKALTLHIYGDANEIRKSTHAQDDEQYTYTGETTTNWAITLSDSKNYWDLTGDGRFRMQTRNSGLRTTHIVI
jgi:hypothetical protein